MFNFFHNLFFPNIVTTISLANKKILATCKFFWTINRTSNHKKRISLAKFSARGGRNLRHISYSPRCVLAEHFYLLGSNFLIKETSLPRSREASFCAYVEILIILSCLDPICHHHQRSSRLSIGRLLENRHLGHSNHLSIG